MSARPPIGARGRRFTLETPLETPDGFGGVIRSYQSGPRLWGQIALLGLAERIRADRAEAAATHRVTFAFRDDLAPDRRLVLGTRRFRIRSAADPDGRRLSTICLVEEITG